MKSKQLSHNLYIIVITLIFFAIGYYFYLEVYTNNKETHIIATKSRILEQMSRNLQAKVKSMETNATEYVDHLLDLNEKAKTEQKNYADDYLLSLLKKRKDIKNFNQNLEYSDSKKSIIGLVDTVINVFPQAKSDYLHFKLVLENKFKEQDTFEFRTSYELLMSDFMKRNIFNEYILIVDSIIAYSTLPGNPHLAYIIQEKNQAQSIAGNSSGNEASVGYIDIKTKSDIQKATIRGVMAYDISISNIAYKIFVCQTQIGNNSLYICGLVDTDLLSQAKRGIAPSIILLIFMIIALIILGLPFIKLKVMSATEHLGSGSLLNSGISLFLGVSLIFLFIIFVANAFWYVAQNETRLKDLAKEINVSLDTEIENAWQQLEYYDKKAIEFAKMGKSLKSTDNILIYNYLTPAYYPYFDYTFWIDTTGLQNEIITPFAKIDKPSNLKNREYFSKPDEWILPLHEDKRFRLESIVSITSGITKVALSKRSDIDRKVIAMTGQFYSVIEPILPTDYKFCIIDKNGLVWLHSDKLRNLQENFIKECSEDKSLSAVIYANATKTLEVNYYDEPYRIHVKPLSPMPLYLVTMFDKHVEYSYQVQGLILTFLLFWSLVLFILAQTVALFSLRNLDKKIGLKSLMIDATGPKSNHCTIYLTMSILLTISTIFYLLLSNPVNTLTPLLFAQAMVSILFPYSNFALNDFSFKSPGRNSFAIFNLFLLILINISSINLLPDSDSLKFIIFQIVIIGLLVPGYFILKKDVFQKLQKYTVNLYVIFLMSLLVTFSVAPSIKFFEASVNHEIIRNTKHEQLEFARQKELRNIQLHDYYKLMENNHKLDSTVESVAEKRMQRGIYSQFAGISFFAKGKKGWNEKDESCQNKLNHKSEDIMNLIRPAYDNISVKTKFLESDSLLDGNQFWYQCDSNLIFNYFSTTETYNSQIPDSCRIYTKLQHPGIFNPLTSADTASILSRFKNYDSFLLWLILIFVLYGFYRIAMFGTKQMFGTSILEMHTRFNFGNSICKRIDNGQSVLIIRSPYINPTEFIKKHLESNYKLSTLDLSEQNCTNEKVKVQDEKNVLIVKNFGNNYYALQSLTHQLERIEEKIRKKEKMVIVSQTAPYLILEYLEKLTKAVSTEKNVTEIKSWEELTLKFKYILSNLDVIFTPEKQNRNMPKPGMSSKKECESSVPECSENHNKNIKCLICNELAASDYLHVHQGEMMTFYEELVKSNLQEQIIEKRIIAKIMEMSRLYYDSILDSCTHMEQFVLCDMAPDVIVNSKNQKVIIHLIRRGLLVVESNGIRFMNESFRKHILTRFTAEEKLKLKIKLGDTGKSWQGYKLMLVLVMIGLFSFLFIANRAFLDNLNKLFIVLGGGTVLITNLTGLLTRKETGNSK